MSRTGVDLEAPEEQLAGHSFRLVSHPRKPFPVEDELKREPQDLERPRRGFVEGDGPEAASATGVIAPLPHLS